MPLMGRVGGRTRAALAACALAGLTACGGSGAGTGTPGSGADASDAGADWRQADALLDRTGLVRAVGDRVWLGDGSTIDVGEAVDRFVVAGDGVFFVPADADDGDLELWFARDGESPAATGLRAADGRLVVSDDGRFLAELVAPDGGRGPELRVFDLVEGTEAASSEHLDLGSEDPEQAWAEGEYHLLGIVDDEVLLSAESTWAYDLATAESREVGEDEPLPSGDVVTNPSGTWRLDWDQAPPTRVRSLGEDDTRVAVRHRGAPVLLTGWVDDDTVHGVPLDDEPEAVLVTCDVPEGGCAEVDGTAGADVVVLDGLAGAVDLEAMRALGEQELGGQ